MELYDFICSITIEAEDEKKAQEIFYAMTSGAYDTNVMEIEEKE